MDKLLAIIVNSMTPDSEATHTSLKPMRRSLPVWVQIAVLLAVFCGGIGVGAAIASRYLLARMQHYRAHPESLPSEVTANLTSRLALSNEQSEKVLEIITRRHGRIESARQASAPNIHSEFDLMEQEVANVLNEHQRLRWHTTAQWVRKSFLPLNPGKSE